MHYHSHIAKQLKKEKYIKKFFSTRPGPLYNDYREDPIAMISPETPKSCSRACCKNQRHLKGKLNDRITVQERRSNDKFKLDLLDFDLFRYTEDYLEEDAQEYAPDVDDEIRVLQKLRRLAEMEQN